MISPSNCANYRVIGIAPSCYRYRTIALPCHYNNVIALSRHRIVIVFAVLHHRFNVIALSRHRTIYTMIDGAMMWLCITRPYPDSIEMSFWYFYIPFFRVTSKNQFGWKHCIWSLQQVSKAVLTLQILFNFIRWCHFQICFLDQLIVCISWNCFCHMTSNNLKQYICLKEHSILKMILKNILKLHLLLPLRVFA